MQEFLFAALSYPTLLMSVLLFVVFAYWLLVIVGAMGVDVLDLDFEGSDSAIENISEGGDGLMAGVLQALKLSSVPLTLVLSLVILIAWVLCFLGTHYLLIGMQLGPLWLMGTAVLASAIIIAFPLSSLLIRPLASLSRVEVSPVRRDLIGKVVRIDTRRVDDRFGLAKAEDGGAGLLVQVRCTTPEHGMTRGSSALIVAYDPEREVYEVTPFEES